MSTPEAADPLLGCIGLFGLFLRSFKRSPTSFSRERKSGQTTQVSNAFCNLGICQMLAVPRPQVLYTVDSSHGNVCRIAQQSNLLVTEDDSAKAAGVAKVMLEG